MMAVILKSYFPRQLRGVENQALSARTMIGPSSRPMERPEKKK
jgi:hypothetical protein